MSLKEVLTELCNRAIADVVTAIDNGNTEKATASIMALCHTYYKVCFEAMLRGDTNE